MTLATRIAALLESLDKVSADEQAMLRAQDNFGKLLQVFYMFSSQKYSTKYKQG